MHLGVDLTATPFSFSVRENAVYIVQANQSVKGRVSIGIVVELDMTMVNGYRSDNGQPDDRLEGDSVRDRSALKIAMNQLENATRQLPFDLSYFAHAVLCPLAVVKRLKRDLSDGKKQWNPVFAPLAAIVGWCTPRNLISKSLVLVVTLGMQDRLEFTLIELRQKGTSLQLKPIWFQSGSSDSEIWNSSFLRQTAIDYALIVPEAKESWEHVFSKQFQVSPEDVSVEPMMVADGCSILASMSIDNRPLLERSIPIEIGIIGRIDDPAEWVWYRLRNGDSYISLSIQAQASQSENEPSTSLPIILAAIPFAKDVMSLDWLPASRWEGLGLTVMSADHQQNRLPVSKSQDQGDIITLELSLGGDWSHSSVRSQLVPLSGKDA